MNIRRYRPGDADTVVRLHERVLRDAGTDPEVIEHPDDIEHIQAEYLDTGGEFLVVEDGEEIVAMGGLRVDGDEAELYRMRVAIDRQGEGIGTMLLEALEDAARERGVEVLFAQTADCQHKAVNFYPRNGYDQIDSFPRGPDMLIRYEKSLDPTDCA